MAQNNVGKTVKKSSLVRHYQVLASDLNLLRALYGGRLVSIIDSLAAQAAWTHSGFTCVTASIDSVHFISPVFLDETLVIKVAVNKVWNTSMEVGAKVLVRRAGEFLHVASAYLTFVALDKDGKPTRIAPVIPKSKDEKRRFAQAEERRALRLKARPQKT